MSVFLLLLVVRRCFRFLVFGFWFLVVRRCFSGSGFWLYVRLCGIGVGSLLDICFRYGVVCFVLFRFVLFWFVLFVNVFFFFFFFFLLFGFVAVFAFLLVVKVVPSSTQGGR